MGFFWHGEVPGPGFEPKPQQWQYQILNPLSHWGAPNIMIFLPFLVIFLNMNTKHMQKKKKKKKLWNRSYNLRTWGGNVRINGCLEMIFCIYILFPSKKIYSFCKISKRVCNPALWFSFEEFQKLHWFIYLFNHLYIIQLKNKYSSYI